MIFGTRCDRKHPACASPPGAPVTQGASWPSSHRFGEIQENAGVVLAGSLPCPGRVVPCFLLPQALAVLELRRLALDNVLIITDNQLQN